MRTATSIQPLARHNAVAIQPEGWTPNCITVIGTSTLTYDNNGNLTTDDRRSATGTQLVFWSVAFGGNGGAMQRGLFQRVQVLPQ